LDPLWGHAKANLLPNSLAGLFKTADRAQSERGPTNKPIRGVLIDDVEAIFDFHRDLDVGLFRSPPTSATMPYREGWTPQESVHADVLADGAPPGR